MKAYNAMQFLDRQGIISLSQEFSEKVLAQFIIESKEVIRYISLNPTDEDILLAILRSYPGIYDMPTALNVTSLAKKSSRDENAVLMLLNKLKDRQVIDYQAKSNDASLTFNEVREDERTINRVSKYLENQNTLKREQLASVIKYVNDPKTCKSKLLLAYFGETSKVDCGICSTCINKNKSAPEGLSMTDRILALLATEDLNSREIQNITEHSVADIIFAIQQLMETNAIGIKPDNRYTLKK
jgi:ATP-dependent DNA helicase RecQ